MLRMNFISLPVTNSADGGSLAGEAILSCPDAIKPLVSAPYPAGGAAAALGLSPPRRGMLPPRRGAPKRHHWLHSQRAALSSLLGILTALWTALMGFHLTSYL